MRLAFFLRWGLAAVGVGSVRLRVYNLRCRGEAAGLGIRVRVLGCREYQLALDVLQREGTGTTTGS